MEEKKDLLYEKFKDRCADNGITGEEGGAKVYKEKDYDFMALVALDKKIVGYLPFDNIKGTMHLNEEKLKSLTFEKLWQQ